MQLFTDSYCIYISHLIYIHGNSTKSEIRVTSHTKFLLIYVFTQFVFIYLEIHSFIYFRLLTESSTFDHPLILHTFIYSWIGLVSKNYEIERACAELEAEVEALKERQDMVVAS